MGAITHPLPVEGRLRHGALPCLDHGESASRALVSRRTPFLLRHLRTANRSYCIRPPRWFVALADRASVLLASAPGFRFQARLSSGLGSSGFDAGSVERQA
jgi:hypothetical protein